MEAGNELPGILAGLQDDVAWTFASWSAGGLTSVRKKIKRGKQRKKKCGRIRFASRCCAGSNSGLDYRHENVARPCACGRGLNCVPFLSNFFNLSRLGQLITGQNDFYLAADGGFSIHDSSSNDGDGDGGVVDVAVDRFFEYAIVSLGMTYCVTWPRANGTFDAKSMRQKERQRKETHEATVWLRLLGLGEAASELNGRF